MPKRSSRKDFVELAFDIFTRATKDPSPKPKGLDLAKKIAGRTTKQLQDDLKSAAAAALGSLGGKKGGPARAKALSKEKRSEIAKKAARTRWKKKSEKDA